MKVVTSHSFFLHTNNKDNKEFSLCVPSHNKKLNLRYHAQVGVKQAPTLEEHKKSFLTAVAYCMTCTRLTIYD